MSTFCHHGFAGATLYVLVLRAIGLAVEYFCGIVFLWPLEVLVGVLGWWDGARSDLWDWLRWMWKPAQYPRWDNYYVDAHTPKTPTWEKNKWYPGNRIHVWGTDPSFHKDHRNFFRKRWKLPERFKLINLWKWPKPLFGRTHFRLWDLCYVLIDAGGILIFLRILFGVWLWEFI